MNISVNLTGSLFNDFDGIVNFGVNVTDCVSSLDYITNPDRKESFYG